MVSALFHYPPTPLVFVYPSFYQQVYHTFCLKSPCTMISPSLAEPPTPHLLFSIFPSSFWSFSVPTNPVMSVTTLLATVFLSRRNPKVLFILVQRHLFLIVIHVIVEIRICRVDHVQSIFPIIIFSYTSAFIVPKSNILWELCNLLFTLASNNKTK